MIGFSHKLGWCCIFAWGLGGGGGGGIESVTGFMQPCRTGRDGPIRVKCFPSYMLRTADIWTQHEICATAPERWPSAPEGQSCNPSVLSVLKSCHTGDTTCYNSLIKTPQNSEKHDCNFRLGDNCSKPSVPCWGADHFPCLAKRLKVYLSSLSGHLTKKTFMNTVFLTSKLLSLLFFVIYIFIIDLFTLHCCRQHLC